MSHNNTTVRGVAPSADGDIDLDLADLGGISGTLSAGTYLLHNGTAFDVTSAPGGGGIIFIGEGAASTYPRTLAAADEVCFFDSSPTNTITGATLNLLSGQSDWYESVTVPAGTYYMRGTCIGDFTASASPNMTYSFRVGATDYGSIGASYDDVASGGRYPYESAAVLTLTAQSTVYLRIAAVSNANATTSSDQSKYGHLVVMVLS